MARRQRYFWPLVIALVLFSSGITFESPGRSALLQSVPRDPELLLELGALLGGRIGSTKRSTVS